MALLTSLPRHEDLCVQTLEFIGAHTHLISNILKVKKKKRSSECYYIRILISCLGYIGVSCGASVDLSDNVHLRAARAALRPHEPEGKRERHSTVSFVCLSVRLCSISLFLVCPSSPMSLCLFVSLLQRHFFVCSCLYYVCLRSYSLLVTLFSWVRALQRLKVG